ncbi:MAG: nitrite reductase [Thermoplasmataceae archaeon]
MADDITDYLKNFLRTIPSEQLFFEAFHDLMKDLIKEYLKKKITQNDELKKEVGQILERYLEAKVKEYDSIARMAKITAKVGLLTAPESLKDEAINEIFGTFRKEIEEIIRRTF